MKWLLNIFRSMLSQETIATEETVVHAVIRQGKMSDAPIKSTIDSYDPTVPNLQVIDNTKIEERNQGFNPYDSEGDSGNV